MFLQFSFLAVRYWNNSEKVDELPERQYIWYYDAAWWSPLPSHCAVMI